MAKMLAVSPIKVQWSRKYCNIKKKSAEDRKIIRFTRCRRVASARAAPRITDAH
jgi:hypothetical protein